MTTTAAAVAAAVPAPPPSATRSSRYFTGQSGDPKEFQNAIAKLQKVDPPEDISEDWNTVMDAWDAKDASEVDLEETQKAGVKVQKFIRDECGVSGQSEN